jgi:DNA-binding XRE family transcriptional regulator
MSDQMDGAEVKALRATLGMTQSQLADAIGVHCVSICRYETDAKRPMPIIVRALQDLEKRRAKIRKQREKMGLLILTGWGIEKMPVHFRLEKKLISALDARARRDDVGRIDVVRKALLAYIQPRDIKASLNT